MKTRIKILTVIISIIILGGSLPAFASGISLSPASSNAKKGESISVTVKLDKNVSAKTGAVEVTLPEGVRVKEGKWLVSNPALSTYDLAKNKGAFAYSSSKDVSGELIILEFEVTSDADKDRNVGIRIEFRDGTKVLFNETESLKIAKNITGGETKAPETTSAGETKASEEDKNEIATSTSSNEESSISSAENSEEKKGDNHSTNVILSIIIISVIILAIISVIVIVIIKKKKKQNDIQEEHHD